MLKCIEDLIKTLRLSNNFFMNSHFVKLEKNFFSVVQLLLFKVFLEIGLSAKVQISPVSTSG